jgi:hypothetical protein
VRASSGMRTIWSGRWFVVRSSQPQPCWLQIAIADFCSKARAAALDKVKLASGDAIAAQLRCADRFSAISRKIFAGSRFSSFIISWQSGPVHAAWIGRLQRRRDHADAAESSCDNQRWFANHLDFAPHQELERTTHEAHDNRFVIIADAQFYTRVCTS